MAPAKSKGSSKKGKGPKAEAEPKRLPTWVSPCGKGQKAAKAAAAREALEDRPPARPVTPPAAAAAQTAPAPDAEDVLVSLVQGFARSVATTILEQDGRFDRAQALEFADIFREELVSQADRVALGAPDRR